MKNIITQNGFSTIILNLTEPILTSIIGLLVITTLCPFSTANAQVKGSGEMVTQLIEVQSFNKIKNSLSSNINIVVGEEHKLSITIDENLLELIDIEVIDGELDINQKEWISPTKKIQIKITAPQLVKFNNSAHGSYTITNIVTEQFNVMSPVGDIILTGKVKDLSIGTEVGDINATNLIASNAEVKIWSFGTVTIHAINKLDANVSKNGKVVYVQEPEVLKKKIREGGQVISLEENNAPAKEVVYINVKLKNNSSGRVNIVFEGPKEASFGYGAPFNLLQTRKERFPVGTKVYLQRPLWKNKLLLEIKEENAGQTIKLF